MLLSCSICGSFCERNSFQRRLEIVTRLINLMYRAHTIVNRLGLEANLSKLQPVHWNWLAVHLFICASCHNCYLRSPADFPEIFANGSFLCTQQNYRTFIYDIRILTIYLPSLNRACSVRITASSVSGPCKWIRSSISFGSILFGLLTVLLGDMMRAYGLAPVSGGERRSVPPFDVTSAGYEQKKITIVIYKFAK